MILFSVSFVVESSWRSLLTKWWQTFKNLERIQLPMETIKITTRKIIPRIWKPCWICGSQEPRLSQLNRYIFLSLSYEYLGLHFHVSKILDYISWLFDIKIAFSDIIDPVYEIFLGCSFDACVMSSIILVNFLHGSQRKKLGYKCCD